MIQLAHGQRSKFYGREFKSLSSSHLMVSPSFDTESRSACCKLPTEPVHQCFSLRTYSRKSTAKRAASVFAVKYLRIWTQSNIFRRFHKNISVLSNCTFTLLLLIGVRPRWGHRQGSHVPQARVLKSVYVPWRLHTHEMLCTFFLQTF
jgi:hypothetical protein